jgi:hypothetical protein
MSTIVLYLALLLGFPGQQPAPPSGLAAANAAPSAKLDYEYFKAKVQPIFLAKRAGHARCISCHVVPTGAIFQLQKLSPGETTWDEDQSKKNFEAVSKLVALPGNAKSPLLVHPLAEDAGGDFFHSGGKHWNSQDDREWQTLKDWIMGQTSNTQARK